MTSGNLIAQCNNQRILSRTTVVWNLNYPQTNLYLLKQRSKVHSPLIWALLLPEQETRSQLKISVTSASALILKGAYGRNLRFLRQVPSWQLTETPRERESSIPPTSSEKRQIRWECFSFIFIFLLFSAFFRPIGKHNHHGRHCEIWGPGDEGQLFLHLWLQLSSSGKWTCTPAGSAGAGRWY